MFSMAFTIARAKNPGGSENLNNCSQFSDRHWIKADLRFIQADNNLPALCAASRSGGVSMSANALSGISNLSSLFQLSSTTGTSQVSGTDSDGDNDGSGVSGSSRRGGGRFAEALSQAFAQIGVNLQTSNSGSTSSTGSSSSTTGSATTDPTQALQTFMQDLFAAMHNESAGGSIASNAPSASNTDSDGDNDASSASSTSGASGHHHHHHGGLSSMENNLQSLIQQLSSSWPSRSRANPSRRSRQRCPGGSSAGQPR